MKLLECPFCGYQASMTQIESAGGNGRMIWIAGCDSEDCDVSFPGHARQVDAAKAWNTRAAKSDPLREAANERDQCLDSIRHYVMGYETRDRTAEDLRDDVYRILREFGIAP